MCSHGSSMSRVNNNAKLFFSHPSHWKRAISYLGHVLRSSGTRFDTADPLAIGTGAAFTVCGLRTLTAQLDLRYGCRGS